MKLITVAGIEARAGSYFSITSAEKSVLTSLAQSTLPIAINAQSILKLVYDQQFPRLPEPINHYGGHHSVVNEQQQPEETPVAKLYPNPNNGNMQFDYTLEEGDNGILIIFNTVGQLITNYQLTEGVHSLQISESTLNNGVYFYQVIVNGKITSSDKLVIIK